MSVYSIYFDFEIYVEETQKYVFCNEVTADEMK